MSTHKAAHQRALILMDAERAVPGITFHEDDSELEIMRTVVARVMGRKFVDGRADDYVIGCFEVIREDGLVAKPGAQHYPSACRSKYH